MVESRPDTIAALSTPPGSGGIAILRVSGPAAHAMLRRLFHPWPAQLQYFHLYLGYLCDPVTGQRLDQVLITLMPSGRSYTGEDMGEIHCHGGVYISRKILTLLFSLGALPAQPGEFTRKAYLSGRLDLVQAEAVAALISSESEAAMKAAASQLAGGLSDFVNEQLDLVNQLLAALEVEIDFPSEEGANYKNAGVVLPPLMKFHTKLTDLLSSYQRGRLLQSSFKIALVGRPNVGKSSVLNALLNEDRVLVSEFAGTTRDVISAPLEIAGIKVEISDTAGLDQPRDELEMMGMERTRKCLEQAALILLILDQSRPLNDKDEEIYGLIKGRPHLIVLNKQDLNPALSSAGLCRHFSYNGPLLSCIAARGRVDVKAVIEGIGNFIKSRVDVAGDMLLISQQRHFDYLNKAAQALDRALALFKDGEPLLLDMLAEELHLIRSQLLALTGRNVESASEDLLELVFSQFCIGK
ncbi:MAG TPA: tRNA uridine-5-carboxymethylaminomethyl(34) synthesis GTPase MnmE [Proteobacteria bacterium]|nr:tRNA uridine-5-carboxymethylaminomethyl(34) synthesis GTPase MnmE [Pseudomonadota bacterium]